MSTKTTSAKKDAEGTGKNKSVIVGPWGGNGGASWDDGTFTGVREITLVYDCCIDSIRVVYDKNGKPFAADKHGGVGGNKTAEVQKGFYRLTSIAPKSSSTKAGEKTMGI